MIRISPTVNAHPVGARLETWRPQASGYEVQRSVLVQAGTAREFTRPEGDKEFAFTCQIDDQAILQQTDESGRPLSACALPASSHGVSQLDYVSSMDSLVGVSQGENERRLFCVEAGSGRLAGQRPLVEGEAVEVTPEGVWLLSGAQHSRLGPNLEALPGEEVQGPDIQGYLPLPGGLSARRVDGTYTSILELRRAGDQQPFRTFDWIGKRSPALGPDGRLFFTRNEHGGSVQSVTMLAYDPADDSLSEVPIQAFDATLVPLRDGRVLVVDSQYRAERVFTVDSNGKTKVFLKDLGESVNIFETVVSPDEQQALVTVETYGTNAPQHQVFRLNLKDNVLTRRATELFRAAQGGLHPFFTSDGSPAIACDDGSVKVFGGPHAETVHAAPPAEAAVRMGRWAGSQPWRGLVGTPAGDYNEAERVDFSAHEEQRPEELGPEVQQLLKVPSAGAGSGGSVCLHGEWHTPTVYIDQQEARLGYTEDGLREAEFTLPASPCGLVALEAGRVLTRAGDLLAVLEPGHAPDEHLRGPVLPLPSARPAQSSEIRVDQGRLTIGGVTLERRPEPA